MTDTRTCKVGTTLEGLQMMCGTFLGKTAYFQLGNILYNIRYQYGRLTDNLFNCSFNGNKKIRHCSFVCVIWYAATL